MSTLIRNTAEVKKYSFLKNPDDETSRVEKPEISDSAEVNLVDGVLTIAKSTDKGELNVICGEEIQYTVFIENSEELSDVPVDIAVNDFEDSFPAAGKYVPESLVMSGAATDADFEVTFQDEVALAVTNVNELTLAVGESITIQYTLVALCD